MRLCTGGLWSKVKGVFGRIGRGVKKGAKWLCDKGKKVAKTALNVTSKAGTAIGTGVGAIAGSIIPGAGTAAGAAAGAKIGGIAQTIANSLNT